MKLGAGLNYLGDRPAAPQAGSSVPGYVTFDAMASLRVNDHLSLQLNGTNLANKFYFANVYYTTPVENHLVPGPGRTVLLTAALGF